MYMLLEVTDATGFHWVLLRVVGFTKLILDKELSVNLINCLTLFFLCIVSAEGRRGTMVSDEVSIAVGKLPFTAETIDINLMGLETIKDLCSCETMT
jgi:hypothetical protein